MERLLEDSYDYLYGNAAAIEAVEVFIEDGYTVNRNYDKGIRDATIQELQKAIAATALQDNIAVYRGVNERRFQSYQEMEIDAVVNIDRFISTTIIKEIAESHGLREDEGSDVITILLMKGTHCFYLSAVNEVPGGGTYSSARQCELIIKKDDDVEYASLDASSDCANGEEEILLGPGSLIKIGIDSYLYAAY